MICFSGGLMSKRVAIYCRVSTNLQSSGLEAQILSCKQYCERNGITDYLIFQDEGISGAKTSRPQLDKMMDLVRKGDISSVVTYSFSRFGRSTIHLISSLEEFNRLGVSFVSVSENLETNTPIGKVIFQILSSLAEFEREQIKSRVKAGMANAKSKGKIIGAKKKFNNNDLFIHLRRQGLSVRAIAEVVHCSPATVVRTLKAASVSLGEAS